MVLLRARRVKKWDCARIRTTEAESPNRSSNRSSKVIRSIAACTNSTRRRAALPKAQRGLPDAPPHVTGSACEQWAIWKRDLELMQMHYSADAVMLVLLHVGLVHSVGKTPVNKRFLHWIVTEHELQPLILLRRSL